MLLYWTEKISDTEKAETGLNFIQIGLGVAVLGKNKFLEKNPDFKPGKPCVYVGMTSHSPEKRFEQHKTGYKSGKFVKDYGIRLKPKQYQNHNPMTYEEVEITERTLAEELRGEGYAVYQK